MAASSYTCVLSSRRSFLSILRSYSRYSTTAFIDKNQHTKTPGFVPVYHSRRKPLLQRSFSTTSYYCSSDNENIVNAEPTEQEEDYHNIIKDTERSKGPSDHHEFQAETRKLLDIVARSLYSEKEVFIRELISNASDALEKLRYQQMTDSEIRDSDVPLEIHIGVDEDKKTFTIQDTGIGMTKEEMIENLGTIAKSGSKEFLETISKKPGDIGSSIIGQFGVGFYSSFMVAEKVEVYSQSNKPGSQAFCWTSDGTGSYDIAEAEGVQRGTKIVLHLKGDSYNYAKEDRIKEVIKKYSNFVGVPIYLNGKRANIVQPLWMMDPKSITDDMHEEFYRFIGNVYDKPRYVLQYKIDAPLNIRALFYVPEYKPTMFDMSRETDVSVNLYSRKVMIMPKANYILPRWLRFMKGVVDSEDIPLNLSRELLQDSALIRKLNDVLTTRIIKFFMDQSKKDPQTYLQFYEDYGLFFREGIVTTHDQDLRERIAKLLRFESSKTAPGELIGLDEYADRMKAGARDIFYLSAPNRQLAERSPYLEALQKEDKEVLFLYEPYDELVLMNLGQFYKKNLKSIENEITSVDKDGEIEEGEPGSLSRTEAKDLMDWISNVLMNKVSKVKVTKRLSSHPCVITVAEMASARHFLRTTLAGKSQEERYRLLQPTLEINPSHPLIKKLNTLQTNNPDLGRLVLEQLYDNAMIHAGLVDDPRTMVDRLNELLEKALDKH